ncbi:MAG: hypothetical protein LBK52_03190, partial [Deltaproteobacteria bacterium]|nr:hypothetical protein [Deltaproteobacteria bacterium]
MATPEISQLKNKVEPKLSQLAGRGKRQAGRHCSRIYSQNQAVFWFFGSENRLSEIDALKIRS